MSISIIFPIEVGDNGQPVTANSSSRPKATSFGSSCFADWSQTDAIKQNLKMLLLTRPGEYVMDMNYGVGLPDYLFMQEQEINVGNLESIIQAQAEKYMPYMTISSLSISIDSLNAALMIRIQFFYNELQIPEVFELEVI